ncbi:MAG: Endonuclease III [Pelotomaculum sp. PtaB.Bin104]|nr:MAG: Endonuclease III [Pelotomaculum sp. PtaB.Bin104]
MTDCIGNNLIHNASNKNSKTDKISNADSSRQEEFDKILERLAKAYPGAGPALKFNTPFELLVAVILSAQCTDKQVNRTTAGLFKKYNTPQQFAALSPEELAEEIKGCGLYRNKSKYIIEAARAIVERHNGRVPQSRAGLEALPGVGRKTAGVVAGVAFGASALPVDTHVHRVARRLNLSLAKDPSKVEEDLAAYVLPQERMAVHHRLIAHGRQTCAARRPACGCCCLKELCRYPAKEGEQ